MLTLGLRFSKKSNNPKHKARKMLIYKKIYEIKSRLERIANLSTIYIEVECSPTLQYVLHFSLPN